MANRNIIQLSLAALYGIAVLYVMGRWYSPTWQENPIYPLLSIILLAVVGGVVFVTVVLPRMGDAVGTMMYSSGEKLGEDKGRKAAALLAQGDYEGAIAEYQKVIDDNPDDTFAISEIAKIRAEHLDSPITALSFLQEHLERQEWPPDNAAFLMFRMVDVLMDQEQYDDSKELLEQIVGNFPGTRHSANANHKITDIEQIQFKTLMAHRAQAAAQDETSPET
ncbi:hypothetical protein BH11VER1_BH11VER1_06110 [soil metagenome]